MNPPRTCCIPNSIGWDVHSDCYMVIDQTVLISLGYYCFYLCLTNDVITLQTWKQFLLRLQNDVANQKCRSTPCNRPCDVTCFLANMTCIVQWIYNDSSLKWHCVGCRHLITNLPISCKSRRHTDTESCHLFFGLKLLIFDGAKWV